MDLEQLLIELGILPCLSILVSLFGLFFIFVKCLSRSKPEQYSDEDAVAAFFGLIFGVVFLTVSSAFLVGAILNNLLVSMLNGRPIHWF